MAPEPGGGLFVSIPAGNGSVVVALLDPTGTPKAGWPVVLEGATYCGQLLSVEDGSVRVLCRPNDLNMELNQGTRAFAFDAAGRALAGWPIDLDGLDVSTRMRRDDQIIVLSESLGDVIEEGQPTHAMRIVTIAADGGLEIGVRETVSWHWPGEYWALGPNGVAYRVTGVGGFDEGTPEASRISALEPSGMLPGWPASFEGLASGPAVGPDGRVLVTTGSLGHDTSRVLAFDPETGRPTDRSAEVPTSVAEFGDTGGCGHGNPQPPVVAQDGTAFLLSWATDDVFALDQSLSVMAGWPYRSARPFLRRDARYIREDAYCPSLSSPAVGPDNVLYLPLYPRDATVGGSLVAVARDGRMRAGWPVELRRPGSEFWSVVAGADGIVYAVAVELESSRTSSATILAIAPDSTVLYATTILDP